MDDPFAPLPSSTPAGANTSTCAACQQGMNASLASYDAAGRLVCRSCSANQAVRQADATVEALDPSTTRNLYGASAMSAAMGILFCIVAALGSWAVFVAPIPILLGGGTIFTLFRDNTIKPRLGAGFWVVMGLSLVGVAFGALGVLLGILSLVFRFG